MGLFDKLLDIACTFDWITPVAADIEDRRHDGCNTFFIPDDYGRSGGDVRRLLRSHGIQTWGHMIVNHSIMITVDARDARKAQWLLQQDGIPIEYGAVE